MSGNTFRELYKQDNENIRPDPAFLSELSVKMANEAKAPKIRTSRISVYATAAASLVLIVAGAVLLPRLFKNDIESIIINDSQEKFSVIEDMWSDNAEVNESPQISESSNADTIENMEEAAIFSADIPETTTTLDESIFDEEKAPAYVPIMESPVVMREAVSEGVPYSTEDPFINNGEGVNNDIITEETIYEFTEYQSISDWPSKKTWNEISGISDLPKITADDSLEIIVPEEIGSDESAEVEEEISALSAAFIGLPESVNLRDMLSFFLYSDHKITEVNYRSADSIVTSSTLGKDTDVFFSLLRSNFNAVNVTGNGSEINEKDSITLYLSSDVDFLTLQIYDNDYLGFKADGYDNIQYFALGEGTYSQLLSYLILNQF